MINMIRRLLRASRALHPAPCRERPALPARRWVHAAALVWLLPLTARAQTWECEAGKLCNPIKFPNFTDFFLAVVTTVIQFGALIIVFMIVVAGFKFVTAAGNSEKVSEARKMLTWIVVGAFVLLGVYVIRAAICGTIGQLGVELDCEVTQLGDENA